MMPSPWRPVCHNFCVRPVSADGDVAPGQMIRMSDVGGRTKISDAGDVNKTWQRVGMRARKKDGGANSTETFGPVRNKQGDALV